MFLIKIILAIFLLSYPVIVYLGISHLEAHWLAIILVIAIAARCVFIPRKYSYRIWLFMAVGLLIAGLVFLFNDPIYLRLYPVMMSLTMLGIFAYSLHSPPTVIESIAALGFKGEEMPKHVIDYTRAVTKVWCVFFVLNASIAAYTITLSLDIWALYNGLISYLLMGLLFAIEFIYRQLVVKKRNRNNGKND